MYSGPSCYITPGSVRQCPLLWDCQSLHLGRTFWYKHHPGERPPLLCDYFTEGRTTVCTVCMNECLILVPCPRETTLYSGNRDVAQNQLIVSPSPSPASEVTLFVIENIFWAATGFFANKTMSQAWRLLVGNPAMWASSPPPSHSLSSHQAFAGITSHRQTFPRKETREREPGATRWLWHDIAEMCKECLRSASHFFFSFVNLGFTSFCHPLRMSSLFWSGADIRT